MMNETIMAYVEAIRDLDASMVEGVQISPNHVGCCSSPRVEDAYHDGLSPNDYVVRERYYRACDKADRNY